MIGPAQRVPVGLLGLLDIRNDGKFPNSLSEVLSCTVDVLKFISSVYSIEALVGNNTTNGTGAIPLNLSGGFAPTPAANEYWYVRGFTVNAATGAAELVRFKAGVGRLSGATYAPILMGVEGASSLTDAAGVAGPIAQGPTDFIMSPGDNFIAFVQRITTAGTIQFNLNANILRFKA